MKPSAQLVDVVRVAAWSATTPRATLVVGPPGRSSVFSGEVPAGHVAVLVFVTPRDARALGAEVPE